MSYSDKPNLWLRVDGTTLAVAPDTTGNGKPDGYWCYGWNTNDIKIIHSDNIGTVKNAICCTTMLKDGKKTTMHYDSDQGGTRGRTAIGISADKLFLFCSKDSTTDAKTPENLQTYMYNLGCKSAIMLDSGGSSSCDFKGSKITTTRKCHNYILVYLKDSDSTTTTTTTTSTTYKTGIYTVTASSLNIRTGAGTTYATSGSYTKGTKVTITEINNGWGKTDKGWVSMSYLSYVGEATSSVTTSTTTSTTTTSTSTYKTGTYKVTASTLNIRSGAGTTYSKVGSYTKNEEVVVTAVTNGWGKTSKGYVSMAYLSYVSSSTTEASTSVVGTYTVTASSLNIRSGAGTTYSKVGSYIKGTVVTIIEISGAWGKTDKGWVSMTYLSEKSSDAVTVTTTTSVTSTKSKREQLVEFTETLIGQNEANGDDDVFIKWYNSAAGTSFSMTVSWCSIWISYCARQVEIPTDQILTTASCTSAMTWFKKQGTWKDAHTGYIPKMGDLIYFNTDGDDSNVEHVGMVKKVDSTKVYTIEGNSSDSVKENSYLLNNEKVFGYVDWDNSGSGTTVLSISTAIENKKGTVTASSLNIRSGAGTTYSIVGGLKKGDIVDVLSTSGSWYKISQGYVSSQYITINS